MPLSNAPSSYVSKARQTVLILTTLLPSLSLVQEATAREVKQAQLAVCADKMPKESILARACNNKFPNETARMELLEALRSTTAFEDLSSPLKDKIDLSDRKFSALYPGSGAHVAPLSIAMKYIDEGLIDEASFTYTEINACLLDQLQYNLKQLASVIPALKFDPANNKESDECSAGKGSKTSLHLTYNGKPITIHFLVSCSGESYFRDRDLLDSKVFISHDPGNGDVVTILKLLGMYMGSMKKHEKIGQKLPPIIMEDLTRVAEYHDGGPFRYNVDMELLGGVTRTKSHYGHRDHVSRPLTALSPNQKCSLSADINRYKEDALITREQLDKWIASNIPPKVKDLDIQSEVGSAGYGGAVILTMNPKLLSMDSQILARIYEAQLIAAGNNMQWNGGFGGDRPRLIGNSYEHLFSAETAKDILNNLPEIFEAIDQVNPDYKKIYAMRAMQALLELRHQVGASVIGYGETEAKDPQNLLDHANLLIPELPPEQREGIQLFIGFVQDYYKNYDLLLQQEAQRVKGRELYEAGDRSFDDPVWNKIHELEEKWKSIINPWNSKIEKFEEKSKSNANKLSMNL